MRNLTGFDLAQRIANLKFAAVTVPNYSYFTDAPRTDILWNRKRAMIVTEELSAAGALVIPHLNALSQFAYFGKHYILIVPTDVYDDKLPVGTGTRFANPVFTSGAHSRRVATWNPVAAATSVRPAKS